MSLWVNLTFKGGREIGAGNGKLGKVSATAIWNLAVDLNCWQDARSIFKLHMTTNCTDNEMKTS